MRAIIDTCVIVDALQKREPFCGAAMDIFLAASNRLFTGVITAKAATDIYYIVRRELHSEVETRKVLNTLFALFEVADTFALDCKTAVSLPINDYEDAVMAQTAVRISADYVITRNLKDYKASPVPAISPVDFLELLAQGE
ncbi:MAG: PIN domain-containing protein [Lachnospiraceae bacterium]|nr:PIN domain-containing protein [Ruminococcus sp.]MCM1277084.1 PIN domain-containing protein [Lachnospiraceae bacterium]